MRLEIEIESICLSIGLLHGGQVSPPIQDTRDNICMYLNQAIRTVYQPIFSLIRARVIVWGSHRSPCQPQFLSSTIFLTP